MMQINILHAQETPKDSQPSGPVERPDPRGDQGGGKDSPAANDTETGSTLT